MRLVFHKEKVSSHSLHLLETRHSGILTSVPVFQSQANFDDLHAQFIVEVSDSQHLWPESFTGCEVRQGKAVGPLGKIPFLP